MSNLKMDKTERINNWYDVFLETLSEKYPQKVQLMQALMELLSIERESVYRRLRKDVAFHILEIVKISTEWNISLDKISALNTDHVPFQMRKIDYMNSSEQEALFLQNVIQGIDRLKDVPETEFMDVCNKLPRPLYASFSALHKFYFFKWKYLYGDDKMVTPYNKIAISENNLMLAEMYSQAIKQVPNTSFVLDRKLFENLAHDLRYFHSIRLITDAELAIIKHDVLDLLEYLNEAATKGCYPETGNRFNLYISQLCIDTNYSYVYTPDAKISFVHVFDKYEIYTFDEDMVGNFRMWMHLKKKSSTQISEVDEKSRIEFFDRQRQLIEKL